MKTQAKRGDIFLPNVPPDSMADYVFICMEPSLGTWAGHDPAKATEKISQGFRNFVYSMEDFILHYAIENFLLKSNQTYYITDVSKGAMTVEDANLDRNKRYRRWYPLLLEELKLLAKEDASYFSVGKPAASCLQTLGFPQQLHTILHYSSQAAASRRKAVEGREDEFAEFATALRTQKTLLIGVGGSGLLRRTTSLEVSNW